MVVFLFVCLLTVIADKHQDAGQSVRVQISVSLAGGRSAYEYRYAGLNSVSCNLSSWLISNNRDNSTIRSLTNYIYGLSYRNIELLVVLELYVPFSNMGRRAEIHTGNVR